jgi:hypothetical protein
MSTLFFAVFVGKGETQGPIREIQSHSGETQGPIREIQSHSGETQGPISVKYRATAVKHTFFLGRTGAADARISMHFLRFSLARVAAARRDLRCAMGTELASTDRVCRTTAFNATAAAAA